LAALQSCNVLTVLGGEPRAMSDLVSLSPERLTLLLFFTHWADLGSMELAQRLVARWDELAGAGCHLCLPCSVQL